MIIKGRIFETACPEVLGVSVKIPDEFNQEKYPDYMHLDTGCLNFDWSYGDIVDIELRGVKPPFEVVSIKPHIRTQEEIESDKVFSEFVLKHYYAVDESRGEEKCRH